MTKQKAKEFKRFRQAVRWAFTQGFSEGYDRGSLDRRLDFTDRSMLPYSRRVASAAAERWWDRVEAVARKRN